jgi:hypothetical protein
MADRSPPGTPWDGYFFEFSQCAKWLEADNADPELVRKVDELAEVIRLKAVEKARKAFW